MPSSADHLVEVNLDELYFLKRTLDLLPNVTRVICSTLLIILTGLVLFPKLIKAILLSAFLTPIDFLFVLLIFTPLSLFTVVYFVLGLTAPFFLLAAVSRDSIKALLATIAICLFVAHLLPSKVDGKDAELLVILKYLLYAVALNSVLHLIMISLAKRSKFCLAVADPQASLLHSLSLWRVRTVIRIYTKSIVAFIAKTFKYNLLLFAIWFPIVIVDALVPWISIVAGFTLFVLYRKRMATILLNTIRKAQSKKSSKCWKATGNRSAQPCSFPAVFF